MLDNVPRELLLAFCVVCVFIVIFSITSKECCIRGIKFGPMSMDDVYLVARERDAISGYVSDLIDMLPVCPLNTSSETLRELKQIYHQNKYADQTTIQQAVHYHHNNGVLEYCKEKGINVDDAVKMLPTVLAVTLALKMHYDRPRPYQLASYLGIPLMPIAMASTASYPSGHTTTAYFLAWYIGRQNATHAAELEKIANDIGQSRITGAMHFPSDVVAGIITAKYLVDGLGSLQK